MPQTGSKIKDDFWIVKTHRAKREHVDRQNSPNGTSCVLVKMGRPWRLTSQTKPTIMGTGLHIALTAL